MTRQTDGKSLYEQQEEQILAQSDAFISLLTKRGILGDHKIDNDKIRKAQQEKNRKSYHNTQLLLQHYRNIAWLLECLPMDIAKELEEPYEDIDKLIDHMDLEVALGNRKLENRMEGIMRTRLLFDRVNEALTVLSHKPDNGKRLYDVIYHTYIRPDKLSHLELLDELREDDLLIITADHGNDPTHTGTDHTREKVPFFAYSPSMEGYGKLEDQNTFAVIGATIADNFEVKMPEGTIGSSLLDELK